ncbi:hypothetical protein BH10PSE12_BH10PSE12_07610 [soil metagenome]
MKKVRAWILVAREWIFPILEKPTKQQISDTEQALEDAVKEIAALDFKTDADVALEETRRVSDAESARRSSADQKAATYLAVVAALVPLILTVATAIWDKKAGSAPSGINMLILGVAIIYVSWAGVWAFRVLEVAVSSRLGHTDFKAAWQKPDPKEHLAQSLLICTRQNHDPVNRKVDRINMAHAFLLRAFLTCALLLLFNVLWYFGAEITGAFRPNKDPWMNSARTALQASSEVADLRRQIAGAPSATAVLDRWCVKHRMAGPGAVLADKLSDRAIAPADMIRRILQLKAKETVQFREVSLRCGTHILSTAKLWYVPARIPALIETSLHQTNIPFGKAVVPLGVSRTSAGSRSFWPDGHEHAKLHLPAILFEQQAVLRRRDGLPIAYVAESYRRGALEFDPE